jgi:prepilin-type N-terminal cleavage/methylation domain-containing protein/prepilin-type processing-associated H-X9-DG protein
MKRYSIRVGDRRGFTLIEILIVVAIIGLLAAILFPVFARARESARRASCQSNLKQIMLAVHQYTQDYDEYVPPMYPKYDYAAATDGAASNDPAKIQGSSSEGATASILYPYLKSTQIFVCPSLPKTKGYNNTTRYPHWSYGYSFYWLFQYTNSTISQRGPVKLSRIQNTAETIMWLETDATLAFTSPNQNCDTCIARMEDRHLETLNAAFVDGHVKAMKKSVIAPPPGPDRTAAIEKYWDLD